MIPKKVLLSLRVPPRMLAALKAIAEAQERPVSEIVRDALQQYIDQQHNRQ